MDPFGVEFSKTIGQLVGEYRAAFVGVCGWYRSIIKLGNLCQDDRLLRGQAEYAAQGVPERLFGEVTRKTDVVAGVSPNDQREHVGYGDWAEESIREKP